MPVAFSSAPHGRVHQPRSGRHARWVSVHTNIYEAEPCSSGMHLARAGKDPDVATRGAVGGPRLVAFASKQVGHALEGSLSDLHVCLVLRPVT